MAVSGTFCGGSDFYGDTGINLHTAHVRYLRNAPNQFTCTACHIAVPHGWKNKALLVNLRDVGPEVGLPPGTEIPDDQTPYTNGPYYLRAVNYIYNFSASGQWEANDCGSADRRGFVGMLMVCNNLP